MVHPHEVGQDHGKNNLKEWRSLSLGNIWTQVHCLMPGIGAQGGSSDGGFTLGKAGRTGRGYP